MPDREPVLAAGDKSAIRLYQAAEPSCFPLSSRDYVQAEYEWPT
ncbi:MAG TPA: hypothetical protein VKD04_14160 [Burkholderiales bacterium]|nr:hypothetical protein [Burkholderiales bacterium]